MIKKAGIGLIVLLAATLIVTCTSSTASTATQAKKIDKMDNEKASLSYALGVLMGGSLKGQGFDLDQNAFTSAFFSAEAGEEMLMDEATANALVQDFQQGVAGRQAEANKKEGEAFLVENGKRSEVTSTESGLQYKVVVLGDGPKPVPSDRVRVHYTGSLIDGTEFDSSVGGDPAEFGVTGVIKGWIEGLQLMPVGSKYMFYLPYDLAYGGRGAGDTIGPFSTLVFEVELLDIVVKDTE